MQQHKSLYQTQTAEDIELLSPQSHLPNPETVLVREAELLSNTPCAQGGFCTGTLPAAELKCCPLEPYVCEEKPRIWALKY